MPTVTASDLAPPSPKPLITAGRVLEGALARAKKDKVWLTRQINRRRRAEGIRAKVERGMLWRWMTGERRINIDDAVLIQLITAELGEPVDARVWSRHWPGPPNVVQRKIKRAA